MIGRFAGIVGFVIAGLLLAVLWAMSILATSRRLRAERLPLLERLFWLAVVAALPLVGFGVVALARKVEQGLASEPLRERIGATGPMELPRTPVPDYVPAHSSPTAWVLVVVDGPDRGRRFPLEGVPAVIGRAEDADLRLENDRSVSRHHAEIYAYEGVLRVHDLNSQHGILINGAPVNDQEVHPGDLLRLGASTLRFDAERTGAWKVT